jgi:uroporphyrin-III C-methyltransferase/precorrin-2 dehydrogenase/sirohydrochlorin ferrochelatase
VSEPVYPLGLRLTGRDVVVIGGGAVALRRVTALLEAGAATTVVSPTVTPLLEHLAEQGAIRWVARHYADGDATGAWLVHACTDDPDVNAAVAAEAERARVWCVRADDALASPAWTPAVGREAGLTVAVHASGDPRRAVSARDTCVTALRAAPAPPVRPSALRGTVALVGAGPGHPGLLTDRARQLLALADVVVTDRLVPVEALAGLRTDVTVVDATKLPGGRSMPQEEINAVLVEHARAGRFVVRLKGGDPFVFGRGMEEVHACAEEGIAVEVVPGVTSAIAVPALAGIPVTHRGASQAFTVVSGHVPPQDSRSTVDWTALARSGATLVVLMGMTNIEPIATELLRAGRPATTPVAVVQEGGTPRQRALRTTLGAVTSDVALHALRSPAVIVVGDVVAVGAPS